MELTYTLIRSKTNAENSKTLKNMDTTKANLLVQREKQIEEVELAKDDLEHFCERPSVEKCAYL